MNKKGEFVEVARLPHCDICGPRVTAYADASLPFHGGSWGNVCKAHFNAEGCSLGLGRGQRYVLMVSTNVSTGLL